MHVLRFCTVLAVMKCCCQSQRHPPSAIRSPLGGYLHCLVDMLVFCQYFSLRLFLTKYIAVIAVIAFIAFWLVLRGYCNFFFAPVVAIVVFFFFFFVVSQVLDIDMARRYIN